MGRGTDSRRWRCCARTRRTSSTLLLDVPDAAEDFSAIGFKLGFTGAACADAAAQLRHFYAASGKARQHVFELRQLYLQLAFAAAGVPGEYVEDELRAVDHADMTTSSILRCCEG